MIITKQLNHSYMYSTSATTLVNPNKISQSQPTDIFHRTPPQTRLYSTAPILPHLIHPCQCQQCLSSSHTQPKTITSSHSSKTRALRGDGYPIQHRCRGCINTMNETINLLNANSPLFITLFGSINSLHTKRAGDPAWSFLIFISPRCIS